MRGGLVGYGFGIFPYPIPRRARTRLLMPLPTPSPRSPTRPSGHGTEVSSRGAWRQRPVTTSVGRLRRPGLSLTSGLEAGLCV